jgi:hypothetical protein
MPKRNLRPCSATSAMPPAIADGLAGHQRAPDDEEFFRHLIALVVCQPDALAAQLDRVAAGHDIDEQPAIRDSVERRRHARGLRGLLQTGTHRDQKPELPRLRRERRGDHPGILAACAGRQEHAEIAEAIGCAGDLAHVIERHGARPDLRPQTAAIAVRRNEPQHVGNSLCPVERAVRQDVIGHFGSPSSAQASSCRRPRIAASSSATSRAARGRGRGTSTETSIAIAPSRSTTTRSESVTASATSCVTRTAVQVACSGTAVPVGPRHDLWSLPPTSP